MEIINSDRNPTMIALRTFNNILQQIQSLNLNFRLNVSPFGADISLKKSAVKDLTGNPLPVQMKSLPCGNCDEDIENLVAKM